MVKIGPKVLKFQACDGRYSIVAPHIATGYCVVLLLEEFGFLQQDRRVAASWFMIYFLKIFNLSRDPESFNNTVIGTMLCVFQDC